MDSTLQNLYQLQEEAFICYFSQKVNFTSYWRRTGKVDSTNKDTLTI